MKLPIGGRRRCKAVVKPKDGPSKRNGGIPGGRPCPGWAHRGSDYCFPHDPTITREARRAYGAAGGRAGRGKPRANLRTPRGLARAAERLLNAVLGRLEGGAPDLSALDSLTRLLRAQLANLRAEHEMTQQEQIKKPVGWRFRM